MTSQQQIHEDKVINFSTDKIYYNFSQESPKITNIYIQYVKSPNMRWALLISIWVLRHFLSLLIKTTNLSQFHFIFFHFIPTLLYLNIAINIVSCKYVMYKLKSESLCTPMCQHNDMLCNFNVLSKGPACICAVHQM